MKFRRAEIDDCQEIVDVVQNTITEVYPRYYPQEIVDFFADFHDAESIRDDIDGGFVYVLESSGRIVGTGSYKGNHITRVYVSSECQGMGYGKYIVENLETMMSGCGQIYLESSLPACQFYEHMGYGTDHHESWDCTNGVVLVYDVMKKELKSG